MKENRNQEFEQLKQEYLHTEAPEMGKKLMMEAIEKARKEKAAGGKTTERQSVIHLPRIWHRTGAAVAAALAILVVTPNISPAAAEVLGNIPLIGSVVKAVTVRSYQVDDGNHQANVAVPNVEAVGIAEESGSQPEAIAQLNRSAEEYTDRLISQFESEIAQAPEGHQSLDIDYQVVTDNDSWFTLKLQVLETQASAYQHAKYYHINKANGQIAHFHDLFQSDADYAAVIEENIRQQMQEQMAEDTSKIFWPDEVKVGREEQNFYFNQDGKLVLVFDEYEVAPGYMGMQEFVIPDEVIAQIAV